MAPMNMKKLPISVLVLTTIFIVYAFARGGFARSSEGAQPEISAAASPLASNPRLEEFGTEVYAILEPQAQPSIIYVGTQRGLFVSDNAGQSWTELLIGNASRAALTVVAHPRDGQILFVGTREGLWQTIDGGKAWSRVTVGLPSGHIPLAVAFCRNTPRDVYLGTARHGIWRSFDGGASWVPASGGLPEARSGNGTVGITSLLADPEDADVAYAGTRLSGLFKTTDGGRSWRVMEGGLPRFSWRPTYPPRLAVSTQNSSILVAAIGRAMHAHLVRTTLYRSLDAGNSWQVMEVPLPANITILSLRLDTTDDTVLYIRSRWRDFMVTSHPWSGLR